MNSFAGKNLIPLLIVLAFGGCSNAVFGPASVSETSAARTEIADRVRFIEKYVTFRRQYENLEYDVKIHNNVPAPSDWDIRLIAVVPPADVDDWIPADADKSDGAPPKWLRDVPGSIAKDGIVEWYRKQGIEVGIDRQRSIVAYRNSTM